MSGRKPGKPTVHSIEIMEKLLLDYVKQHPNEKISFLSLEKATGIGRNTWERKLRTQIEKLNAPLPILDMNPTEVSIELPNIAEFVEAHYENKEKLIDSLTHIDISIKNLYTKAKKAHLLERENAQLIEELKNQKIELAEMRNNNHKLKKQVTHYSGLYRNIAASSTYSEKGLNNVIEFNKDDKGFQDALSGDLIKQFDMFKPKDK